MTARTEALVTLPVGLETWKTTIPYATMSGL